MILRRLAAVAAIVGTVLAATAVPANAATDDFGDYSRMFTRSAGQYWSGDQVGGQWAWNPQSSNQSLIGWGQPSNWPAQYQERFVRSGDWVVLDGWSDNGTYYSVRVTRELIGDQHCNNMEPLAGSGGRQHYVRWTIPDHGYCLKAWGTITEESSGRVVDYGHTQIWSPPSSCSNPHYGSQTCIKQWESWWDNRGSPGEPIQRKLDREQLIAKGIGMAFQINQFYPTRWHADLRHHWTW